MKEKTKKWFLSLALRSALAAAMFILLFLAHRFMPSLTVPIKPIFTESADIGKIGTLLKELMKEAI